MATAADFRTSRNGNGRHSIPSSVLLSLWCPSPTATRFTNATTATSTTSSGVPISVTFCAAARPPAVSHLSLDFSGLELDRADLSLAPMVLGTDADLALLHVPISRCATYDYFVYRVHSQVPRLDRLPSPNLESLHGLGDNSIAILSCGDGKYAVAALEPLGAVEPAFRLYLYRSGSDGRAGSWTTSQRVVVENPLRDVVCHLPDSAWRVLFHLTSKVIVLGGAKGTVGWVDLWRGILLCDVLDESPKLRDMPLPLPSFTNWGKYVEMERTDPWSWKATIWTMPIPVTWWGDWRRQCYVRSEDIDPPADIRLHFRLLHRFYRVKKEGVAAIGRTVPLGRLHMAYPTLGIADDDADVVYLLCDGINAGLMKMVFAVDVRTETLRGMVKLDAKRRIGFFGYYFASGISKHLKTSGNDFRL
ncbi:unnamed protein product [Urochloa decumbens]|uniref:DUF1618 domain-containing protein n=1 Tax=Urochloa decumbens TaxID=240449 RepID=A0ABC8ZE09_9POAL